MPTRKNHHGNPERRRKEAAERRVAACLKRGSCRCTDGELRSGARENVDHTETK